MNSASMATNLLGRPVRLRRRPDGCASDEGSVALVMIDSQGFHFLILVDGRLITIDGLDEFTVLD